MIAKTDTDPRCCVRKAVIDDFVSPVSIDAPPRSVDHLARHVGRMWDTFWNVAKRAYQKAVDACIRRRRNEYWGVELGRVPRPQNHPEWLPWWELTHGKDKKDYKAFVLGTVDEDLVKEIRSAVASQIRESVGKWPAKTTHVLPDRIQTWRTRYEDNGLIEAVTSELKLELDASGAVDDDDRLIAWWFGYDSPTANKWYEKALSLKDRPYRDDGSYPSTCDWTGGSD